MKLQEVAEEPVRGQFVVVWTNNKLAWSTAYRKNDTGDLFSYNPETDEFVKIDYVPGFRNNPHVRDVKFFVTP